MATYATDLTEIANADDDTVETTWDELSGLALGGSPADDDENYIQGVNCQSQTTGTKSGLNLSIAFDNGTDISSSFVAGDCVFIWSFYAVGANLETYATGGLRVAVGASLSAFSEWDVGGSDYGRNPYGGWQNVVVDPTLTADDIVGGGHGGAYQVFGTIPYTLAAISKGTPHAVDRIMYGRGEIYCTGTGCDFAGMAQENDYNDVTSGYNRWGLFSEQGGVYLWKGLMSLGQTGTSATFSDSNKTIIIDDAAKTYAAFNKIEVNNASTSVTWTNISFTALGTVSKGTFEMIDNATVNHYGCTFNDMNTFDYLSNGTSTSIYNSCAKVTTGGANVAGASVLLSTVVVNDGAVYQDVAYTDTYLDGMTISKGTNAHHAIDFGTAVTSNLTLRDIEFTGFGSTDDSNDSTVRFLATGGSLTLSLIGCTVDGSDASLSNFSVDDTAGITVTVSIDPVDITITVEDVDKVAIENAQTAVFLLDSPFTQLMNEDTLASGIATESYGGSLPVDIKWRVRKSETADSPRYKARSGTGEITSSGFTLSVTMEEQPLPI